MESIYMGRIIERINILLIVSFLAYHSAGAENIKCYHSNTNTVHLTSFSAAFISASTHLQQGSGLHSSFMDVRDIGLDANASIGGVCSGNIFKNCAFGNSSIRIIGLILIYYNFVVSFNLYNLYTVIFII